MQFACPQSRVSATLRLAIGFMLFIGGGVTVGVSGSTKFFFLIGVGFRGVRGINF